MQPLKSNLLTKQDMYVRKSIVTFSERNKWKSVKQNLKSKTLVICFIVALQQNGESIFVYRTEVLRNAITFSRPSCTRMK